MVELVLDQRGGAVTTDPYWNNVTFLLNYTNGYADASPAPKALQAQGTTAARSNVGGVFSAGSDQWHGVFNGASTSILQYDNSSNAFNFGTRNFTIDGWINPSAYHTSGHGSVTIMSTYYWGASDTGWALTVNTAGRYIQFFDGTSGLPGTSVIPLNQWTHVAIIRVGTVLRIYVNGVLDATRTCSANFLPAGDTFKRLKVGGQLSGSILLNQFNGRMDELRITDGIVRYTDNFTPPTAPYPVTA